MNAWTLAGVRWCRERPRAPIWQLLIILSKVNPLHGPIYVEGVEPGDTLEVEIVKLQTGSWGWTGVIPHFGLLGGDDRGS